MFNKSAQTSKKQPVTPEGEGGSPLKFWHIWAAHLQKVGAVKITKNGGAN